MLARTHLDPQEALVCTMVLVAAAETGGITDREIGVMATLVQTLPIFERFSNERLQNAADSAVNLLREDEGLPHAGRLIRDSLEPRLRETAFLASELRLDNLVIAAIERGTRARYQRLERNGG